MCDFPRPLSARHSRPLSTRLVTTNLQLHDVPRSVVRSAANNVDSLGQRFVLSFAAALALDGTEPTPETLESAIRFQQIVNQRRTRVVDAPRVLIVSIESELPSSGAALVVTCNSAVEVPIVLTDGSNRELLCGCCGKREEIPRGERVCTCPCLALPLCRGCQAVGVHLHGRVGLHRCSSRIRAAYELLERLQARCPTFPFCHMVLDSGRLATVPVTTAIAFAGTFPTTLASSLEPYDFAILCEETAIVHTLVRQRMLWQPVCEQCKPPHRRRARP